MSYLLVVVSLSLAALGKYLLTTAKGRHWAQKTLIGFAVGFLWLCSVCLVLLFLLAHLITAEAVLQAPSSPSGETSSQILVNWGPVPTKNSVQQENIELTDLRVVGCGGYVYPAQLCPRLVPNSYLLTS
jgi:hypothetical protein